MKNLFSILNTIALYSIITATAAFAGGPLASKNGAAVKYDNTSAISYKTDQGLMGSFSNVTATNLTMSSFQTWQDVATAQITFTNGGQLPVDVTGANYTTYLDNFSDGINPMIFDTDGSIVDSLLGEGASNNVIGFAGSSYFTSGPNAGKYAEGQAVMNGKFANNPFTEAQFKATFVHEFGHFIGLDHSQINGKFAADGNSSNDIYIPTMYPTSTDDDTKLADLNPDDIASVSSLYPKATFATTTGKISGAITRFDNSVVRGANIIAISTGADSLTNRISTVSDYLVQNTGNYTVVGLAPGSYYIQIEPVKTSFIEGSSVGPYATSATDLSFINPVVFEYYNAGGESSDPATDSPSAKTSITVTANATTSNINLIANKVGDAPITDVLQYHSGLAYVTKLPSKFDELRYAVRFTPGANAKFVRTEFYMNGAADAVKGTGTLKVSLHQNSSGVPGTQMGTSVNVPFAQITKGTFNVVDFSSQNLQLQANVDFHVAFEVIGVSGDTLQFVMDDGTIPTSRSSSYFNSNWLNFIDPNNFGIGYNLAVKAVIDIAASVQKQENIVSSFRLDQNYPNPFNPSTTIAFSIPSDADVTLKVYSILGKEVATVVNEPLTAGDYTTSFDARTLASGMYFYTITAGNSAQTKKMLLLK
ncbi:MAG: T9SS type A sorting domain-containing protein [Bacteroidota bacterium]